MFCAVHTDNARDVAQAYQITGIPNFKSFLNGKLHKEVTGANEPGVKAMVSDLENKVPKSKVVRASKHDELPFNQFKPTHLAPQSFNTQANMDKMKGFIQKFVASDTVKNEVGEVKDFQAWLNGFNLEYIP